MLTDLAFPKLRLAGALAASVFATAFPCAADASAAPPASTPSAVTPVELPPAAPKPAVRPRVLARALASGGLPTLALGVTDESLLAVACRGRCDWGAAVDLGIPRELLSSVTHDAVSVLSIGQRRKALRVKVGSPERSWQAVVAASPEGTAPVIAHAGFVGYGSGTPGQRQGHAVEAFDKENGEVDVVVGDLDESVQLCGRSTLLGPRVLHAPEMKLRGIRFQRLTQAERDAAPRLAATLDPEPVDHPVLQARVASTGTAQGAALTDGNIATAWAEKRGGDGSGEFIVTAAPPELSLSQIHFRLRPEGEQSAAAVGPRRIWLALRDQLFHVTFPEDAWGAAPGAIFSVTLPQPVKTDCLALVLDAADREGDVDVTIAELSARAEVTDEQIAEAVAALAGDEASAAAAGRLLSALGAVGHRAVDRAFAKLPERGKLRALSLLDAASCQTSARAYALAIDGELGPLQQHGERSLRRCAPSIVPRLLELFANARGARLQFLGELLVGLAPDKVVDVAVAELAKSRRERRQVLRELTGQALAAPPALARVGHWLGQAGLSPKAKIDLLRASGDRVVELQPQAAVLVHRLLGGEPDFRTRYLLLGPLARLATVDASSEATLVRFVTGDPHPAVRAEAARLATAAPPLLDALMRATNDDQVRVREAAVTKLGEYQVREATGLLVQRVETDRWPLVRAAGVRALRELPASADVLSVLADTVELDVSPEVRRPAVLSLGLQGGHAHLDVVRDVFRDDPDPHVQAAAAAALAQLCDYSMLEELTESALALAHIGNSERATIVGRASLAALGRLHPKDLKQRLKAFESPDTPVIARTAARLTLSHPEPCPR